MLRLGLLPALLLLSTANTATLAEDRPIGLDVQQDGNVTSVTISGDGTFGTVINDVLALRAKGPEADGEVVSYIERNRDVLPPPYYLEAARRLCTSQSDIALQWVSLYSIRSRYDAMRCVDPSAIANVQGALFSLQLPECQSHFGREGMAASLSVVASQPDLFQSEASPWWICSGGVGAIVQALEDIPNDGEDPKATVPEAEWLRPETEWPAIRQQLIDSLEQYRP